MAAAVPGAGPGRDGGAVAATARPCGAIGRGGGVRDGAAEGGASALGAAQDSGVVSAPARECGLGEQFQAGAGASGFDPATATPATGRTSWTAVERTAGRSPQ